MGAKEKGDRYILKPSKLLQCLDQKQQLVPSKLCKSSLLPLKRSQTCLNPVPYLLRNLIRLHAYMQSVIGLPMIAQNTQAGKNLSMIHTLNFFAIFFFCRVGQQRLPR